ncbi:hypothetical protein RER_33400 [Rhodococcus erythropolis PR4]|uniref:Uncharacterized protein n=1 Tax=Rhodococcus erythropolis (strain PR4 / NBRC 100887) TaxID=234621 RepID=C1A0B3_RHOE4|nr:hypothetical protein RER_33400 [Rhodococcus erythropolis PR4]
MSSVKVYEGTKSEATDSDDSSWVAVRSPRTNSRGVSAGGVISAIAGARLGYIRGARRSETYSVMPEYGSGDAALSDGIDRDMANRWDD